MENRIMGYARVSSTEQNLDRQLLALEKYVVKENIVTDKTSGKNFDRPGYQALKGPLGLRKGDTLVIKSLDRLSRNKSDIKNELEWFKTNNIRLKVIDLPTTMIEVTDGQDWIIEMVNNILIEVLASIAQQERETIKKRQREGIEAAKVKGKHLGRPKIEYPKEWDTYYEKWKAGDMLSKKMMQELHLKRSSFYQLLNKYEVKIYEKQ